MEIPKVLLATSIADVKAYCIEEWLERINRFTYPNFEVYLVDNTADGGDYTRILRRKFGNKFKYKLTIDWYYEDRPLNEVMANCMNIIRDKVLNEDYDYLFSLEQDIFPPRNDIIETLMLHKKLIVNGMYPIGFKEKRFPILQCVEKLEFADGSFETMIRQLTWDEIYNFVDGGVKPVHGCGIGCALIKKGLLRDYKFRVDNNEESQNSGIHADSFFYMDLWNSGVTNYVDTSIMCEHKNSNWKSIFELRGEQKQWEKITKRGITG